MIVIVEGIDRVGKSTLIEKLVSIGFKKIDTKMEYRLDDIYTDSQYCNIIQQIQSNRINAQYDVLRYITDDVVIDRWHLSQLVYGIIKRNDFDKSMLLLDRYLSKLNALLVFVDPVDIDKSIDEHGEDLRKQQCLFDLCKSITKMQFIQTKYTLLDDAVEKINTMRGKKDAD